MSATQQHFFGWLVTSAVAGSIMIAVALSSLGLNGPGLVACWWLFLVPSGIFVGYVLGECVHAPVWARLTMTVVGAAFAASIYPYG